ncbi:MAG: serpin family protein, partial [Candidatus Brocadiia bacterium]
QELELANDKDYFTTASGRKVKRVFQDVLRPGGILSGQTGAPDLIELPFDDGLSMLIVMPQVWDPALAIADLDALSTRKKELIWYDCMDLRNPVFRYSTGGPLEPRLNRMGFSGNYLTGLPFLGAAMLGRAFEVKTDATAVVVWGGGGVLIDAETTTIFSSVGIDRPQIRVALNRPFLYAIRHDATGIIVGLGWVVDPVIEKME